MPRPDRARSANEGIPLQIVDRTTIVASAIGVRGHKKPHVIEAERSGRELRASGRGKAKAALVEDDPVPQDNAANNTSIIKAGARKPRPLYCSWPR